MAELFDESHFFMCSGGMKPARMKKNQDIVKTENNEYYLTKCSLRCNGLDFTCRWAALLCALIAAAMALLMSCPAGWVLLAAIAGAAAGAALGSAICGDMAAIVRVWVVIKVDAKINELEFVANRPGEHIKCSAFNQTIMYVPNVTSEFYAYALFAGNVVTTGLEAFMYVYAFRGAGLLLKAPTTFLSNFGVNYLASLTMKGVVMRTIFGGYSAANSHYLSPVEGGDPEKEKEAALDGFFFIERAAIRIATMDYKDPDTGEFSWSGLGKDATMMFSMGGIPGRGKDGDAQKGDVGRMANQVANEWSHPVETAKAEVGKIIESAKQFREQIRKFVNGKGAHEKPKFLSVKGKTAKEHAFEEMQNILDQVKKGEIGKRQIPESLEVAINKKTGEIIIGKNKTLNKGNPKPELHKNTESQFKEGSKESWNERNCSEADVVDQINKKGDNPNDYEYHAVEIDPQTGKVQDKHTCRNCDVNMEEQIKNGDVTSNTPESKARRGAKNKNNENK